MRRRSVLRFPSYRNLAIYHQLAYKRRTQTAVAAQLGLSQRRVSQIGQQVQVWVDSLVRPRQYVGRPGMRFHLAVALERIRLQQAHGPLVELFTGADDGRSENSIAIGERGLLVKDCGWGFKLKAGAGSVVK